jgi:cytochrome c553
MAMKLPGTHLGWLAVLALLAMPVPLYAGEAEPDVNAGQQIFNFGVGDQIPACQKCHGPDGMGLGAVDIGTPRLASQVYTYLVKQLTDFATDRRTDTIMHQMNRIARGLSPQQRKDVAAYLHLLKWPFTGTDLKRLAKEGSVPIGDPVRGGKIIKYGIPAKGVPACQNCHGYEGQSTGSLYPMLSGQNYLYLRHELAAFRLGAQGIKENARNNDFMSQMRAVAGKLSDQDINDVAAFMTGAKPPPAPDNPHDPGSQ